MNKKYKLISTVSNQNFEIGQTVKIIGRNERNGAIMIENEKNEISECSENDIQEINENETPKQTNKSKTKSKI